MSKGNHFLGTAQGKVGDAVFYRANGEQRTRVLVTPKNPRSRAQMEQRVRIADVAAIYRAARQILKDSFEIKTSRESSYNAFAKNAIPVSPFMSKEMVAACLALPIPAQASRGSLVSVDWESPSTGGTPTGLPYLSFLAADEGVASWGDWSDNFIRDNSTYQNGDRITMVMIRFEANEASEIANAYNAVAQTWSAVLDTESIASMEEVGLQQDDNVDTVMYPIGWNNYQTAAAVSSSVIVMGAIIMSRKDENGKLRVSSQYFGLNRGASELYDDFRSVEAMDAAVLSYGVGEVSPLNA